MSIAVLVTGGAGYVGSHVCKALAAAGFSPVTYDNLSHGDPNFVRWGPLVVGDIADQPLLLATMRRNRIQAVMHFAALIEVGRSMREPLEFFDNNVAGTIALLRAAVASNIRAMVFSSTCAVYGVPIRLPLDEDHPRRPINPYGVSKLMVEQVLDWADIAHGVRYAALRYFNAAGADPDGELGEAHDPETHLVPLVLAAAEGRAGAVEIFGDDWDTRDGTCIRDYVHVADLADAHVLALRRLLSGGGSLKLNLGTGEGHSVRDVISAVQRMTGRGVKVKIAPRRDGDSPALVADASRAKATLGWRPRRSSIDEIVETGWRWQRVPLARRDRGKVMHNG
ncbi:MAG: UDP-glucose 4-epimerase GalE [Stellaceae bacterium]